MVGIWKYESGVSSPRHLGYLVNLRGVSDMELGLFYNLGLQPLFQPIFAWLKSPYFVYSFFTSQYPLFLQSESYAKRMKG